MTRQINQPFSANSVSSTPSGQLIAFHDQDSTAARVRLGTVEQRLHDVGLIGCGENMLEARAKRGCARPRRSRGRLHDSGRGKRFWKGCRNHTSTVRLPVPPGSVAPL